MSLSELPQKDYVLLVALSVFEHMTVNELQAVFEFSRVHRLDVIFTVPIALYEGGDYINPVFEEDKSHTLRRPVKWWSNLAERYGYRCMISDDNQLLHGKTGMILVQCKLNG